MTSTPPVPTGPPLPGPAPRASRWDAVPPPQVRWGLPDAAILVAIVPVGIAVGSAYLALVPSTTKEPFTFVFGAAAYLVLIAGLVLVSLRRGQRSLRADFGLAFRWIDLPMGIGIAVLGKLATVVFGIAATIATGSPPRSGNFVIDHDTIWIVLTGVLIGTLVAPFTEELLFRGAVLRAVRWGIVRGWRRARPQPAPRPVQVRAVIAAILVNSALFAALHLWQAPSDPALFITLGLSTLTLGVLHSIIVIVTGRLGPAIVSHVVFNGSSVLLQVLLLSS
jgi:membrane protease YdiL (CAAX protease family)